MCALCIIMLWNNTCLSFWNYNLSSYKLHTTFSAIIGINYYFTKNVFHECIMNETSLMHITIIFWIMIRALWYVVIYNYNIHFWYATAQCQFTFVELLNFWVYKLSLNVLFIFHCVRDRTLIWKNTWYINICFYTKANFSVPKTDVAW